MLVGLSQITRLLALGGVLLLTGLSAFAQTNSLQTSAKSPDENVWELKWSFGAAGENFEEGFNEEEVRRRSSVFDTRARFGFKYWLNSDLFFDFQPLVKFQTGRNQSIDGADRPSNSLGFKQAAVQWLPTDSFWLSAGALNQRDLHSSLVTDELPFPAARLTLKTAPQSWDLRLLGEASIPASNGLDTGTNEIEPNPYKTAAQIQINWVPKPYLKMNNKFTRYSYHNLPLEVAKASSRMGNSTKRVNEEDYEFVYQYQGYEASSDWQLPILKRWDLLVQLAGAQNAEAPSGLNTGYSAGGGLRWLMNSRHHMSVISRYFHVEPDVAPAYFSNRAHFRTNRVGYETEALWHLRKQKFSIGFAYQEAEVIYQESSQSRARLYMIKLETDDATL